MLPLVGQQRGDRLDLEPYQESIGYLGPLRFSIPLEQYVWAFTYPAVSAWTWQLRLPWDPRQNLGIQR
jgi:hypothetical protein